MVLEEIKINRDDFKYEQEVTEEAIKSYCKYPRFKEYTYKLNDKKTGYILQNTSGEITHTADILTSIKSPINKLIEGKKYGKKIGGKNIVYEILNDSTNMKDEFRSYVKLFAKVYYTIGNMLPVESNPFGLGDRDTWRNKILVLLNFKEENKIKWTKWILQNQNEKLEFIKGCCLNDMIDNSGDPKPFFSGIEKWNQVLFSKKWSIKEKQQWFLNNSKLIIERGHRINNCTNEEYYGEDGNRTIKSKEEIEDFFKSIFKDVGMEKDVDITLY